MIRMVSMHCVCGGTYVNEHPEILTGCSFAFSWQDKLFLKNPPAKDGLFLW